MSRCPGVAVPLRVVPSPTGLPSKRPSLLFGASHSSVTGPFSSCSALSLGIDSMGSNNPLYMEGPHPWCYHTAHQPVLCALLEVPPLTDVQLTSVKWKCC